MKKSLTPPSPAKRTLSGMEARRLRKEVNVSDWSELRGRAGREALFVLELVIVLLENGAGGDFVAAEFRGLVWEAEREDAS